MAARDTTRSLSWLLDAARDSRKKCRSKRCQSRARPEVPFQPAFYAGRPLEYTRAACSRIGTGIHSAREHAEASEPDRGSGS